MNRLDILNQIDTIVNNRIISVQQKIYTNDKRIITGNRLQIELLEIIKELFSVTRNLSNFYLNTESDTPLYKAHNRVFIINSGTYGTPQGGRNVLISTNPTISPVNVGDIAINLADGYTYVYSNNDIWIAFDNLGIGAGYTDEDAQNAIGAILQDTVDIDFSYTTTPNVISALLTTTGVTAGIYGDGATIPQVEVDNKGRVIDITPIPIVIPPTITFEDTANIDFSPGVSPDSYQADLTDTGVVANTYGSATQIPIITVDAKGRINSVSTALPTITRENEWGRYLFVNPLNTTASDAWTIAESLGRPDRPFLTINGALALARLTNTNCTIYVVRGTYNENIAGDTTPVVNFLLDDGVVLNGDINYKINNSEYQYIKSTGIAKITGAVQILKTNSANTCKIELANIEINTIKTRPLSFTNSLNSISVILNNVTAISTSPGTSIALLITMFQTISSENIVKAVIKNCRFEANTGIAMSNSESYDFNNLNDVVINARTTGISVDAMNPITPYLAGINLKIKAITGTGISMTIVNGGISTLLLKNTSIETDLLSPMSFNGRFGNNITVLGTINNAIFKSTAANVINVNSVNNINGLYFKDCMASGIINEGNVVNCLENVNNLVI